MFAPLSLYTGHWRYACNVWRLHARDALDLNIHPSACRRPSCWRAYSAGYHRCSLSCNSSGIGRGWFQGTRQRLEPAGHVSRCASVAGRIMAREYRRVVPSPRCWAFRRPTFARDAYGNFFLLQRLPHDLCDAAMSRVSRSKALLGTVTLDGIVDIDPVWRPLLNEIACFTELCWVSPGQAETSWFKGKFTDGQRLAPANFWAEASADPKSEVVEALRWARQLLSSGQAKAEEVAIAATSTPDWDDHFLAYANDAGLPLHFSHGVPALSTPEGQACAALADMLTNGLSQERVWRLFRRLPARPFMSTLPDGLVLIDPSKCWSQDYGPVAGSANRRPIASRRASLPRPYSCLFWISSRVGPTSAERQAGCCSAAAASPCGRKLRSAPPHAIALSLQALRVRDGRDPANSVVWCPASHLAASPRPFVRLLGLTSRCWPRFESDDPLIPDHLLDRRTLHGAPTAERDRLHFDVIRGGTLRRPGSVAAERNAKGSIFPRVHCGLRKRSFTSGTEFLRTHSVKLIVYWPGLAKQGSSHHVRQSQLCWRNWQREPSLTRHDGLVAPDIRLSWPRLGALNRRHRSSACCVIRLGLSGATLSGWRLRPPGA